MGNLQLQSCLFPFRDRWNRQHTCSAPSPSSGQIRQGPKHLGNRRLRKRGPGAQRLTAVNQLAPHSWPITVCLLRSRCERSEERCQLFLFKAQSPSKLNLVSTYQHVTNSALNQTARSRGSKTEPATRKKTGPRKEAQSPLKRHLWPFSNGAATTATCGFPSVWLRKNCRNKATERRDTDGGQEALEAAPGLERSSRQTSARSA